MRALEWRDVDLAGKVVRLRPEISKNKDGRLLPLQGEQKPRPLIQSPANGWDAHLSPDNRLLAYVSDESGQKLPANDAEQRQSRTGTFYIFDGVHKTLVLATLLLRNLISYKPVNALLFVPRD